MHKPLFSSILLAFLASLSTAVFAGEERLVIELSTDDFEIVDADVSHLEPGDAETIVTENGKRVDILRTLDGVEIYLDGELIESGFPGAADHTQVHKVVHKKIEILCDDDADCEDIDWSALHESAEFEPDDEKIIVIRKEEKIH